MIDNPPVHVGKKHLDVLAALSWCVVEQKGVFPHIHHENRFEARYVAMCMQCDPMVRETAPQPQVLLEEFGSQARIFTLNYWLEIRLDVDPNEWQVSYVLPSSANLRKQV